MSRVPCQRTPRVIAASAASSAALSAVLSAALGTAFVPTVHAQPAGAEAPADTREISIPVQALGEALNAWARQTGKQLAVQQALVAGRTAPAVEGRMSAREALGRLLSGSGLAADVQGDEVTIRRAQTPTSGEGRTLPHVAVRGDAYQETATGPVIGYAARRAASATKTDTPLLETPQSVEVVTQDQIIDRGVTSVQDTITYTAGARSGSLDARGDTIQVRGTAPTMYLDGLPLLSADSWYDMVSPSDVYTLERVEVLRGPAGMLFGAGTAAGVVNMVSKRPLQEAHREIGIQVGSYNRRQIQTDLTGPLTEDGQWSYRLVGVFRESGTQVDHVPDDRRVLAPALTWRPNAQTSLTLRGLWQQNNSGSTGQYLPLSGTVLPNPNGQLPPNRFIGEPSDYRYNNRRTFAWQFEHRFSDAVSFRQNFSVARNQVDEYSHMAAFWIHGGGWPEDPINQRLVPRSGTRTFIQNRVGAIDNLLETRFQTGGVQHRLLTGLDFMQESQSRAYSAGTEDLIDAYNPVYGNVTPDYELTEPSRLRTRNFGVYVQDQMRHGNWIVVLGLRHDRNANQSEGSERAAIRANTKRIGLLHAFPSGWSPYLSYTESFTPQAGLTEEGDLYKPLRGEQIEAGLKYAPTGGRMSATASVYRLKEKNRTIADFDNPFFGQQVDSSTNRGVELDVKGRIGSSFQVIGAYSYLDMDRKLGGLPKHQVSIWGRYDFSIAGFSGFTAGAGVRYMGSFSDRTETATGPKLSSVTLADLLFAYDTTKWRLALNVNNATDKAYFGGCYVRGDCWWASRRTVLATATYRF